MKHSLVLNFRFRSAFTLAEVLVTLGIIGIVAALTLPALIANHQKKVIAAQLKTNYSLISQAYNRAQLKYGESYNWPYVSASANPKPDLFGYERVFEFLKTTPCQRNEKYENALKLLANFNSNMLYNVYINERYGCYMLKNGAMIFGAYDQFVSGGQGISISAFALDANSFKPPNQAGKDIHTFFILHNSNEDGREYSRGIVSAQLRLTDKPGLYGSGYGTKGYENSYPNCMLTSRCTNKFITDGFEFKKGYDWK